MPQTSRPTRLLETASDVIESGAGRALEVSGGLAERAREAVEELDLDRAAIESSVRRAVGSRLCDVDCVTAVERARDRERLRAAVIAGLVLFLASAVVLLIAREIATRRRVGQTQARQSPAPMHEAGAAGPG